MIENGRQKTITKKTKTDRNGNQTTEIIEEYKDPRTGQHIQNKYIENGMIGNGGQSSGGAKQIQNGGQKKRRWSPNFNTSTTRKYILINELNFVLKIG